MEWIYEDRPNPRVLWLTGPVGAGKSTVMYTIANRCAADDHLAASFFFPCSGMGHYWWKNVIPMLAAQFRFTIPGFEKNLQAILKRGGDVSPLQVEIQARSLITQPLHSIQLSHPMVIIIDGLEQCEADHRNSFYQRQELQHLLVEQLSTMLEVQSSIRLIISSRLENHLTSVFETIDHRHISLDSASEKDLAIVLRTRLRSMYSDGSNTPWPDDKAINTLVWKCSGQFTYVTAVLRFIAPHPPERLRQILGHATGNHDSSFDNPFEQLDRLYLQIFQTVRREIQQRLVKALGAIVLLRHPPDLDFLQTYTGMEDIFTPLLALQSVLHI